MPAKAGTHNAEAAGHAPALFMDPRLGEGDSGRDRKRHHFAMAEPMIKGLRTSPAPASP